MPVFVAAVRRVRTRRQGGQFQAAYQDASEEEELWQPAAEAKLTEPQNQSPQSEEGWIKRNLKEFYTEFESEREKAIVKNTPPVSRRFGSVSSEQEATVYTPAAMEQDRVSPLSPGLQQGTILIPTGVEKSFKSRRSFSEFI